MNLFWHKSAPHVFSIYSGQNLVFFFLNSGNCSCVSFLTFILDRTYNDPLCKLRLMSDLPGEPLGLRGCPSAVLDGSWAWLSDEECLVRQRGTVSAGLASTSVIRTEFGKMETGWTIRVKNDYFTITYSNM